MPRQTKEALAEERRQRLARQEAAQAEFLAMAKSDGYTHAGDVSVLMHWHQDGDPEISENVVHYMDSALRFDGIWIDIRTSPVYLHGGNQDFRYAGSRVNEIDEFRLL